MGDVLRKCGAKKGDRVIIYMPMIPEALVAMLACARIGAVHSLVFGGFSAKELSVRVDHCKVRPNFLVCYFATPTLRSITGHAACTDLDHLD